MWGWMAMIKVISTKGECETKDNKKLQQNEDVIDGLFLKVIWVAEGEVWKRMKIKLEAGQLFKGLSK